MSAFDHLHHCNVSLVHQLADAHGVIAMLRGQISEAYNSNSVLRGQLALEQHRGAVLYTKYCDRRDYASEVALELGATLASFDYREQQENILRAQICETKCETDKLRQQLSDYAAQTRDADKLRRQLSDVAAELATLHAAQPERDAVVDEARIRIGELIKRNHECVNAEKAHTRAAYAELKTTQQKNMEFIGVLADTHTKLKEMRRELITSRVNVAKRDTLLRRYLDVIIKARELVLIVGARCDNLMSHADTLELALAPGYTSRPAFIQRGAYDNAIRAIINRDVETMTSNPDGNYVIDVDTCVDDLSKLRDLIPLDVATGAIGVDARLIAELRDRVPDHEYVVSWSESCNTTPHTE